MSKFSLFGRVLQFRNELGTLWRAFRDPATPLILKAAMVGVLVYLVSPLDLIPEFIPILGLVDDVVLVPLMVSWIVSRLPTAARDKDRGGNPRTMKTVNGTARRR